MSGFYVTDIPTDIERLETKCGYLRSRGECVSVGHDGPLYIGATCGLLDGTIYNKSDLWQYGDTDSKIIHNLYKAHGEEMVKRLNGSFAFVLYDREKHVLFGARDRFGEKPFFYRIAGGIECSSSLKAICSGSQFPVNENARSMYIRFGWIYDSECIFEGIHKLPAGHYFTYDLQSHEFRITKYWDVDKSYHAQYKVSHEEVAEYLDSLIADAIKIRVPDGKIGMGISSGTDSFSIYNYLRGMGYEPELFSIVPKYMTACYNEYPKALEHVRAVDPHKEISVLQLTNDDCVAGLDEYVASYEEPNSDFSCIITNRLFDQVRKRGMKVAFSGIGADDFLFGKPIYGRFFNNIAGYILTSSILSQACQKPVPCNDSFAQVLDPGSAMSLQWYNVKTYLPNLLVKEDVASQQHGVEVRSPFCDYRIAEFASNVGESVLYQKGVFKYLLKQIVLDKFKVDFFGEPKRGFAPEIRTLVTVRPIAERLHSVLTRESLAEWFPEISYADVEGAFKYATVQTAQCLLNLYMYITVMQNYRDRVCV